MSETTQEERDLLRQYVNPATKLGLAINHAANDADRLAAIEQRARDQITKWRKGVPVWDGPRDQNGEIIEEGAGWHNYPTLADECADDLEAIIDPPEAINVVFDGPPGPTAGRFIEVETDNGESVRVGEWIERDDGLWALRIDRALAQSGGCGVPEKPLGAIHNAEAFFDRLENHYSFECEAGPLSQCTDWLELRRCFDALREYVAAAPEPDPEKNDEV